MEHLCHQYLSICIHGTLPLILGESEEFEMGSCIEAVRKVARAEMNGLYLILAIRYRKQNKNPKKTFTTEIFIRKKELFKLFGVMKGLCEKAF